MEHQQKKMKVNNADLNLTGGVFWVFGGHSCQYLTPFVKGEILWIRKHRSSYDCNIIHTEIGQQIGSSVLRNEAVEKSIGFLSWIGECFCCTHRLPLQQLLAFFQETFLGHQLTLSAPVRTRLDLGKQKVTRKTLAKKLPKRRKRRNQDATVAAAQVTSRFRWFSSPEATEKNTWIVIL